MRRTWRWRKVEFEEKLKGAEVEGVGMTEGGGQRGVSDGKGVVVWWEVGVKESGEDKEEELTTESKVLTCVSVSQGQAVAVFSFSCCPSQSASELISPSFTEMKQTSDSSSNCRATDLLSYDSDATFSTSHVTVRE